MTDWIYQVWLAGDDAIAWAASALLALIISWVAARIKAERLRQYVTRAIREVGDAVAEVYQTYVAELKEANADGKLTPEEKIEARRIAIAIARSNIGQKGLLRLGRILGTDILVEDWLGNKVEAAVDARRSLDPR